MEEKKNSSQSIFVTLDTLKTETSVPGQIPKMQPHTLPRKLFPTSEQFENKELLLAWTEENGFTHAALQLGVTQFLIKCRASFKACKKEDTWTPEYGQKAVNSMTWDTISRPKGGQEKVRKAEETGHLKAGLDMARAMRLGAIHDDAILAALTNVYGTEIALEIMNQLNQEN